MLRPPGFHDGQSLIVLGMYGFAFVRTEAVEKLLNAAVGFVPCSQLSLAEGSTRRVGWPAGKYLVELAGRCGKEKSKPRIEGGTLGVVVSCDVLCTLTTHRIIHSLLERLPQRNWTMTEWPGPRLSVASRGLLLQSPVS